MNSLLNPTISVVIPVYNVERYIRETLDSVFAQTLQDFEIIIVDDESPDRSIEICQSYQDPRIRIVHQKNRGLAGARNTGIRNSCGKYIALLDSDDLWLPEKLEYHLKHLESNPEVGVSFCRSAFIDDNSKPLDIYQMPKLTGIDAVHIFCRNPISNGSVPVFRREVLEAIKFEDNLQGQPEDNYFDEHFHQSEDIECWMRIALQTQWQIEGIPEALTLYRVNSTGLSAHVEAQLASWEMMVEKTRTYAPEFVSQWESLARAYQYRYLARRAIRNRDGQTAVQLINKSLQQNWHILTEETPRTLITITAAYIIYLIPQKLYLYLEKIAIQLISKSQKNTIYRAKQ
ncbi:MAG: glycosyltransferase family 2 protein [Microcystaceae cyanobacterium]